MPLGYRVECDTSMVIITSKSSGSPSPDCALPRTAARWTLLRTTSPWPGESIWIETLAGGRDAGSDSTADAPDANEATHAARPRRAINQTFR